MDNICRLCLTDTAKRDIKTLTKEVLLKVSCCFGHDILLSNSLPQTICQLCCNKIEDIHAFREKIIENQNILLKLLEVKGNNRNDNSTHDKLDVREEPEEENKANATTQNNFVKQLKVEHVENISTIKRDLSDSDEKFDSGDEDVSLSTLKRLKEKDIIQNLNTQVNSENEIYMNFSCLTCFKISKTHYELLQHYNEEHKSNNDVQVGNEQIENKYDVDNVDGCMQYKCTKCNKVYGTKNRIKKHLISHDEYRPFVCKLCGRTYKTASEIARHGRAHNGLKMPCRYRCGFSTVYLGALKEHERRHTTEYSYTCDKCGKGFQVLTWYEQHQNVHTGLKPFVCEICGLAFHMDRYLKAHVTSVHPQASSTKRFVCVHCSLPCDSKKSLTIHLKEHGIITKFLCDICGKVMADGSQLKLHKRMHLNHRPYSCGECGKSFARRSHLSLHSRTHSSDKAHECTRCERTYTQRATLLRHIRRFHNGNLEPAESGK